MGNVIQWADAVKALQVIAEEQQAVSGMSVAEAASALKYTRAANGMYLKTVMSTVAESAVGTTATEAIAASTTKAATTTAVNLTLVEGAGGAAKVAGIGSIALPIAACIAAATGGYLIGKELNKNPVYSDFFDKLVYRTADFLTGQHLADELIYDDENAPTVPLLFDANGNAYLPNDMASSIKNFLDTSSGNMSLDGIYSYYHITNKTYLSTGLNNYPFLFVKVSPTVVSFIFTNEPCTYNPSTNGVYFPSAEGSNQYSYIIVSYNFNGSYYNTINGSTGGWDYPHTILYSNHDIVNTVTSAIYYAKSLLLPNIITAPTTPTFNSLDEVLDYFHVTDKTHLLQNYTGNICVAKTDQVRIYYTYDAVVTYNNSTKVLNLPGTRVLVAYGTSGGYSGTWTDTNNPGSTGALMDGIDYICYANYDVMGTNGTIYHAKDSSVPNPNVITKYTVPTPATTPITDPNGKVWKQVYLPETSPAEMPDPVRVPSVATPQPTRVTPYIPPYQPQPAQVPIVIPDVMPANPLVIPNPEPNTSTAPYPAPNPASDPSQLAEPVADSEPVQPLPEPVNVGSPVLPVVPSVPSPSSAKGLLHVYNPTPAQVDLFGEWLWTTFSGDIIDTISKLFNNPMDAVIGLHELYCTPAISASDVNIRAGYLESNVPSRLVTSRYKEINCGALSVPEYWGNYLDYAPYTKSYCYLPFIGIVELNTDDIVGSGVEITYRVDTYNGSCIALITTAKPNSVESITYQFEGNCAVSVPITSGMMTSIQNALIGVATTGLGVGATAAVTVASGGMALPAAVMAGSVAAGATKQGLTTKNQVSYSGSFGSSYGAMGVKKPFLIIKRPKQKVVYGYNENYGYPAHTMVLISTCTGYLRAIEVDVVSPTATEAEKKMIEQLLKSGVFVD